MSQLRIAICDDEASDLQHVLEMMRLYDANRQMSIQTFSHASALLEQANSEGFDIILLDIEMTQPNGYDVAKELKKQPSPPVIIFVTKSSAYTLQGYGIALRYLTKPLDKDLFFEAMDAAVQEASAHRLTIVCDDTTVVLPMDEVLYVEMFGHYAQIHTAVQEYRFRGTLKEISAILPRQFFAQPHKSIIVNLSKIRSATNEEIRLINGERLPLSRRRLQEFHQALYRFLGR